MASVKANRRVLIVEDLATLSVAYSEQMSRAGYAPVVVATAAEAMAFLATAGDLAAILLDLQLPDANGLDLLQEHPAILSRFPVIVVTSDSTIARAVDAMRLGAFDYLVKPVPHDRLVAAVDSALASRLPDAGRRTTGLPESGAGDRFVGQSPEMQEIYRQIALVANSRATVLITGETGTGKEVCAESIHRQSSRADRPFIAINCGAIPDSLMESELFGHVKGAFTGAVDHRVGAAQAADGGTLFLDELCEMPLQLQVKLLRFLQTGTVKKLGEDRSKPVDVRVVCATNRDPLQEVIEGRLRQDLYYRLAVIPIEMPPLRRRAGDLPLLADFLLAQFAREAGKTFAPLTAEHLAVLASHDWPGNIRELQNVLWRATLLNEGPELPVSALDMANIRQRERLGGAVPSVEIGRFPPVMPELAGRTFSEIERLVIEGAISASGGSVPGAAQALGLSASTIYRKLKEW